MSTPPPHQGYQGPPQGEQGYQGPPQNYQGGYQGPPGGYQGPPGGYPPPRTNSNTPLIVGVALLLVLLVGAAVFLLTRGDDVGDYSASGSAPAAPGPAAPADAPVAAAIPAAAAPAAPAPAAASPSAAPSQSRSSSGSYSVGVAPGNYTGGVDATGLRQFCENYDQTSVARLRGLMVCYNIEMQQHRDGSLQGTGYKSWEVEAGTAGRDLDPAEQSPIRVTGYIDNSDTIHIEYTVQGARRATKGVATFNANREAFTDSGGNPNWGGTFRSSAANASGSAGFTAWALKD